MGYYEPFHWWIGSLRPQYKRKVVTIRDIEFIPLIHRMRFIILPMLPWDEIYDVTQVDTIEILSYP